MFTLVKIIFSLKIVFFNNSNKKNKIKDTTLNIATKHLDDYLKITYVLTDNSFIFLSTCSSTAKTQIPLISALDPSKYQCTVDTINN